MLDVSNDLKSKLESLKGLTVRLLYSDSNDSNELKSTTIIGFSEIRNVEIKLFTKDMFKMYHNDEPIRILNLGDRYVTSVQTSVYDDHYIINFVCIDDNYTVKIIPQNMYTLKTYRIIGSAPLRGHL